MKRLSLMGTLALILLLTGIMAACSPSPKEHVSDFLKYMPEAIGTEESGIWELDDRATVELRDSTVTAEGHAALTYEGPDDELAFIIIKAYASEDAAEVAYAARERELLLRGLEFDTDRQGGQATADLTQEGRVRYAFFLEGVVMVEIDTLAPSEDAPVSDDLFEELLVIVRSVFEHTAE